MRIYKVEVPMAPQGKGRGRAVRVGAGVRVITPTKTRTYEATVADLARAAVGELLLQGPLGVRIWAVFPRSKEMAKIYKKTGRPKHPSSWIWAHRQRVDTDNLAKAIMDALTKAGIWADDRQVARLEVHKVLAEMVETPEGWRQAAPRVVVQITEYSAPGVACYQPPAWVRNDPPRGAE